MIAEGAAIPWNQPLSAQSEIDTHSSVEDPIARFISADRKMLVLKNSLGLI